MTGQSLDGRRLRGARTRHLIVESYLALLREELELPTAANVAARASCSMRSIFERFGDLDALRRAAVDHALIEAHALAMPMRLDGDRATRIDAHVASQSATCEHWLPLRLLLARAQRDFPDLADRLARARQANVQRVKVIYRPEIDALPVEARDHLPMVLATLASFESWVQLRASLGHSIDAARLAWREAIDRLLPAAPVRAL